VFGSAMVECSFRAWMVSVAGTPAQITQGLKGMHGAPFATGLWCNFGEDCYPIIDTTGMLFNMDLIFVSSGMEVVDMYREVAPGTVVASRALAQYCLQIASLSAQITEFVRLGFDEEDVEDIREDYALEPRLGSSVFVVYFMLPTED